MVLKTFRRPLKTFPRHLKTFPRHLKTFPRHLKTFRRPRKTFPRHLKTFRRPRKTFPRHLKTFRRPRKTFPRHLKTFRRPRKTFARHLKTFCGNGMRGGGNLSAKIGGAGRSKLRRTHFAPDKCQGRELGEKGWRRMMVSGRDGPVEMTSTETPSNSSIRPI